MRIKSVSYWLNQIISAEENKNTKEPENSKDLLNYQIAEYYIGKEEQLKEHKLVA